MSAMSYPVTAHSYLGTSIPAVIRPNSDGEELVAVTLQALGAIGEEACEGVTLYIDTCPEAGERGVLRAHLTVAETKHLIRVLQNALGNS